MPAYVIEDPALAAVIDEEHADGLCQALAGRRVGDCLSSKAGPPPMVRLIVCTERPHPGAQLRITDADGMRITCFATHTLNRPIANSVPRPPWCLDWRDHRRH